MTRKPLRAVLLLSLVATAGCGTLFFHNPQMVRVTTNVPGALVIAKNEAILGRIEGTTAEFPLERKKSHTLLVSAHGNEVATVTVESHYSWWRIIIGLGGDILLGFLPPPILWGVMAALVDMGSGAWKVLDDEIVVNLRPRTDAAVPPAEDPSTERPASTPVGGFRRCTECGATDTARGASCERCGTSFSPDRKSPCSTCGEPRRASDIFCPTCGLK